MNTYQSIVWGASGPGKPSHLAKLINARGGVSAWCVETPKKIKKALWTLDPHAVTCDRCLTALERAEHV